MSEKSIAELEKVLKAFCELRLNEVTRQIEVKLINTEEFRNITDRFVNDLLRNCLKNSIQVTAEDVRRLLESSFVEPYHPFRDYLNNVPVWDGHTDYIQQLADTVKPINRTHWGKCLPKWLVAVAASMYEDNIINHTALVLMGRQGLGKSRWINKLVPDQLKGYYFSGTINPDSKDTLIHLAECMLIHLDELENLNRTSATTLKEIMTKEVIRYRTPYGRYAENRIRIASFVGSVNSPQFLNDPTGSRRFLCFEATEINYEHKVSIDGVFSQAMAMFSAGFRYYFNTEEQREVMLENEQFTVGAIEDDHLSKYFIVADDSTVTDILTTTELLQDLHNSVGHQLPVNNSNRQRLGRSLTRKGFTRVKRDGVYKYLLQRKKVEIPTGLFSFDNVTT